MYLPIKDSVTVVVESVADECDVEMASFDCGFVPENGRKFSKTLWVT